jgi:PAS domain S-box-containing protein
MKMERQMSKLIKWLETMFATPPSGFLVIWGQVSYVLSIVFPARASENSAQQVPRSGVKELSFLSRSFDDLRNRLRLAFRMVKLGVAAKTRQSARLQALFDAAQEIAIIATDADGRITEFNHGAERMLGYTASAMMAQSPLVLHRESDICQRAEELTVQLGRVVSGFEALVALARPGIPDIRDWTCLRSDGGVVRVSLAISAVCDAHGQITGFLGIARDITQQLEAEASLRMLNRQLDLQVQERTQALQESTQQLQSAVDNLRGTQAQLVQSEKLAALGSIVAGVAHELNTPIGNCVCVASTLLEMTVDFEKLVATGKLPRKNLDSYLDDSRTAMHLLQRGLERAAGLISNFKQVAVDQGTEQRRHFQLNGTINEVVDLLRATLRDKGYRIELDIADAIRMDSYPGAIEQIISSLVNNSVLHGFAGRDHGRMRLRASADEDEVVLTFSDDGLGMTEEVLGHVFDPFFTTRLGTGGSGLGMHVCYNLVTRLLGGSVEVSSVLGQGAEFTFVLPRVAPLNKLNATALPICQ